MADTYRTLKCLSTAIYTDKRSKFLAFAHPCVTAAEAKALIADYRKRYFDARHVCWAYVTGIDRADAMSSDDGEPSGTAGRPIMGQINSLELSDIVVIVVRYFGGIKLGTPGLIAAYKTAARQALDAANIEERHRMAAITVEYPYIVMNQVMKLVKASGADVRSQQFDNLCRLDLGIRADNAENLLKALNEIDGAHAE